VESFDQLVVQYQPMIHKIIQSLHIYKNKDEFYQTGLIALWEATQAFDERKGNFPNYAYTYMKGKMLLQMNQHNHYNEKHIYQQQGIFDEMDGIEPLHFLEKETIHSYCEGLTEKEAKWVIAMSLDHLSIKEIAERENVSVSAVKQWRAGALRKLRETITNHN
jgi:RNA polymerase sigma factor (sigma-70 family)